MFKNKPVSALFLTITLFTLLWACTSGAMFDGFKKNISQCYAYAASYFNSKQLDIPQPLKPFGSDEAKKNAYRNLVALEEKILPNMVDYDENYSVSQAIQDIETEAHRDDLIIFYQRLFRSIVVEDIKNKEPYTISLGLKIGEDGNIIMENLPLSVDEKEKQNVLLTRLNIDPKDASALKELKELYKTKKNTSKSAERLFPKIVVLKDDDTTLSSLDAEAIYNGRTQEIYICEKDLSLLTCGTFIHEFTHRLQDLYAQIEGGITFKPLTEEYDDVRFPTRVAMEKEAESRMINLHPNPGYFAKQLEKKSKNQVAEYEATEKTLTKKELQKNLMPALGMQADEMFPYLTTAQSYGATLKNFNLKGNSKWEQLAIGTYERRKNIEKNISSFERENMNGLIAEFYPRYSLLAAQTNAVITWFNEKNLKMLANKNLTPEQKSKITASNPLTGSKELFDIRCKVLKELEEEEKRAKNKHPFPMKFSVDFSKKFENKN